MKKVIMLAFSTLSTACVVAQVNPILRDKAPKKQQLPIPEIQTIKPDLTVEIERISSGGYNMVTQKTTIKVLVAIRNNSDASAPISKIAASVYNHSTTNPDHIYWHLGQFKDAPAIPPNGIVRRLISFEMDNMPKRTTPYPFKVEIDKSYNIDEADETNNDSNEVEITIN